MDCKYFFFCIYKYYGSDFKCIYLLELGLISVFILMNYDLGLKVYLSYLFNMFYY